MCTNVRYVHQIVIYFSLNTSSIKQIVADENPGWLVSFMRIWDLHCKGLEQKLRTLGLKGISEFMKSSGSETRLCTRVHLEGSVKHSLLGPTLQASDSLGLWSRTENMHSNMFLGDTDVAALGTML